MAFVTVRRKELERRGENVDIPGQNRELWIGRLSRNSDIVVPSPMLANI